MRAALPYLLGAFGLGLLVALVFHVRDILRVRNPCPACGGEGKVTKEFDLGWIRDSVACDACGGSGRARRSARPAARS